ncbi:MAG TPA: FliM/FliN family flagellar motor switch protein [Thermoguttaceae bacterium]|nr:FliM/FliN family flagellar motor switch protein [Thermoguttaceae bacterium]
MLDFTSEIVDAVVAACEAGAQEAAEGFRRALGTKIALSVGEAGSIDMGALPEDLSGPGLAVVLTVGYSGALVLLPDATGLVPDWCADPDPTGQSKLDTLAQELGMLLLPEEFTPEDFKAGRAKNLTGAMRRGGVGDGANFVPLDLSAEGKQGTAYVVWPVPKPAAVLGSASAKPEPAPEPTPQPAAQPAATPTPAAGPATPTPAAGPTRTAPKTSSRLRDLPVYTRSLLRIQVPIVVTLAEKRQPLGRIVELGPGSIIQFEKSCEEMLELGVGDHLIATGEAVKVGDKFGLRITSIKLPEERFLAVKSAGKR